MTNKVEIFWASAPFEEFKKHLDEIGVEYETNDNRKLLLTIKSRDLNLIKLTLSDDFDFSRLSDDFNFSRDRYGCYNLVYTAAFWNKHKKSWPW